MEESLWNAPQTTPGPDVGQPVTLTSAFSAGNEIQPAEPFTVSLESVYLSTEHVRRIGWIDRVFGRNHDLLIYSTTTRGASAPVQRVHYHQIDLDLKEPLFKQDMLSDTVHICTDYNGTDDLYIDLHVTTPSTLRMKTDKTLHDFAQVAGQAGAFPVLAPYLTDAALGVSLAEAIEHLFTATLDDHAERIHEALRLAPPGTAASKALRYGRYVAFDTRVDGTQYQLQVNGGLAGPNAELLSYAVFRIDQSNAPTPDFVVSQRAATLLTGLKQQEEGDNAGGLTPAVGFLKETIQGYSDFQDLKRYHELKQKSDPSEAEKALMQRTEARDDLTPFLT